MATHDYVISNASGAAVRADLNNALAAIVSNNSNATEPSTTYSYMLWADTGSSPPVMKLRNAANDGWVTLFQLDGEWTSIAFEDGSAAAPSIYFKDSGTDTGFFSGGTDQVNVSTGGVERVEWGASEVVFNDGGANYDFRIEGDTNSSLFFVDASADAVGLGTSLPGTRLVVEGDGNNLATITVNQTATNWNSKILFAEAGVEKASIDYRNSTWGGDQSDKLFITNNSNSVVLDSSGRVGIGTTSPGELCSIAGPSVTGTVGRLLSVYAASASGTGSGSELWLGWNPPGTSAGGGITIGGVYNGSGTDILFSTPANISSAPTEKARIDSSGRLLVGTSSAVGNYALQIEANNGTDPFEGAIFLRRGLSNAGLDAAGYYLGTVAAGSQTNAGGFIRFESDAAWGSGDYPTRMVFSTTADGASSPTERVKIQSDGTFNVYSAYNLTTANAANVHVLSGGALYRSTSSSKYKTDVETLQDTYSDALLECRPVWYRSTCNSDNPNFSYWGFIAEEVAAIDPRLVQWKTVEITYDEKGAAIETPCDPEPEGVQYERFVPHLLNLIKRQKEQIEAMEARLSALEGN